MLLLHHDVALHPEVDAVGRAGDARLDHVADLEVLAALALHLQEDLPLGRLGKQGREALPERRRDGQGAPGGRARGDQVAGEQVLKAGNSVRVSAGPKTRLAVESFCHRAVHRGLSWRAFILGKSPGSSRQRYGPTGPKVR